MNQMTTHQPVRPALNAVLSILSIVTDMTVNPAYADEVAAEIRKLDDVIAIANTILDLLEINRKGKLQ